MNHGLHLFRRIAVTVLGAFMMAYGFIAAFSPLPAGAVFVIIGLLTMAAVNPGQRPFIRRLRARWPFFNRLVRLARGKGPEAVETVIRETEPGPEGEKPAETKVGS